MSLDPISPLTSSSLLGVGLHTGIWVCVMLGLECSVCRRVIDYHTRVILRQKTDVWRRPPRTWSFSQVRWFRCPQRRSARSWLSSFSSQTAYRPMTIFWRYYNTSIFTSRRDSLERSGFPVTLGPDLPLRRSCDTGIWSARSGESVLPPAGAWTCQAKHRLGWIGEQHWAQCVNVKGCKEQHTLTECQSWNINRKLYKGGRLARWSHNPRTPRSQRDRNIYCFYLFVLILSHV